NVGRQGEKVASAQNVIDEGNQIAGRTDFQENFDAIVVHLSDRFAETHLARPLQGGEFAHLLRRFRKKARGGARIQRHLGPADLDVFVAVQIYARGGFERGSVITAVEGQPHAYAALLGEPLFELVDRFNRTVQHLLVAAIVHRDLHFTALQGYFGFDLFRRQRAHRQQRAGRNLVRFQQLV